jgi:hypothetical protein
MPFSHQLFMISIQETPKISRGYSGGSYGNADGLAINRRIGDADEK